MAAPRDENLALVELLDRVLETGAVLAGDLQISVAGVDLLYVNLRVLITTSEKLAHAPIDPAFLEANPPRSDTAGGAAGAATGGASDARPALPAPEELP